MAVNDRSSSSAKELALALGLFLVSIFGAMLAAVAALIIWLGERLGSMVAAATVVALFFSLLAVVSYLLSLREAVARFTTQMESLSEMADLVRRGYRWFRRYFGGCSLLATGIPLVRYCGYCLCNRIDAFLV